MVAVAVVIEIDRNNSGNNSTGGSIGKIIIDNDNIDDSDSGKC